jgi:hypothetical protein
MFDVSYLSIYNVNYFQPLKDAKTHRAEFLKPNKLVNKKENARIFKAPLIIFAIYSTPIYIIFYITVRTSASYQYFGLFKIL